MTDPRLRPLPSEPARAHLSSIIEMNGDILTNQHLKKFSSGQYFVIAPDDLPFMRLLDFARGGIFPSLTRRNAGTHPVAEVSNQSDALSGFVRQIARMSPASTIFIREPYNDELPRGVSFSSIGASIYRTITGPAIDEPELAREIKYFSVSWSFLAVVSEVCVGEASFDDLMAHSGGLAVNVYDGESYMLWINSAGSSE